ncbi:NAD-dependent epimerase/dehydratase family protein [Paenibacillus donghaensis]|uniref:NAD-dependent epimerase n=1 Tax=Paenibacillus donghaensis TaxID=414771 RepID=A0A2Z2KKI7_9BACL|nr:NAD-dependent epimerase/dehydratase family protein [Paenibacillus donghaensis]ASA23813.1 NAD-dependent epimerase [Paenibacillus donghaensis]
MEKRKILITGKGSYVGTSFIKWLEQWPDDYETVEISVRGEEWNNHDFSQYDVVLHVAGIAHVSTDPKMEEQYYKVNRDLTIEVAKKAKKEGVKQFIFMSSIIVYGDSSRELKVIDRETIPKPSNFYGHSKLQAEKGIMSLEDGNFKIVIIRPPMIYGKGSKGNYIKLAKLARKLPFFPRVENQRSMLYIDNLCELLRLLIINRDGGIYFPQNGEYVNTSHLVSLIAKCNGRNIRLIRGFNIILLILSKRIKLINKIFGNLVYKMNISEYKTKYQIKGLSESILITENEDNGDNK